MSGSISFRFKKPVNWAYAPGLTKAGADGSVGKTGFDGNAIYFIDYELNNSYNIELAQQKLENNFTLSGNSVQISEDREYHSGDIIISDRGSCYRIEKGIDPYYTFSINHIGNFSIPESVNNVKVLGLAIYKIPENDTYKRSYNNFIPNNRQTLKKVDDNLNYQVEYRTDSEISYNHNTIHPAFSINGLWYKFLVIIEDEESLSNNTNIKYTLEINLKNRKSYHFNSVPDLHYDEHSDPVNPYLYGFFNFNKTLEFSVPVMPKTTFENNSNNIDFIINYGNAEPYFLSDMSMDKVHLFGTDIRQMVVRQNNTTYCSIDGVTAMREADSDGMMRRHNTPTHSWPDSEATPGATAKLVPAVYSKFDVEAQNDEDNINWRGGESAYFSSIKDPELAIDSIEKFLTSALENAEFNIVMHNISNGEVKIVNSRNIWTWYNNENQL